MQFLTDVRQKALGFANENSAALLTAGGVVGTVATAILAGRAGYKYSEIIRDTQNKMIVADTGDTVIDIDEPRPHIDTVTKVKLVGLHFLPPVITGVATIGAIIMSHKVSAQKAAALAAAYGLAERNLSEYREKVAEKLTGPKKTSIDDDLAQDRVNQAGPSNLVVIEGEVLCYDEATNRYFRSTMENIKKAVNSTNNEIHVHEYADATFFYHELGLEKTVWSDEVGWNRDNILEVKYTTAESPDQRPCIAINFATFPRQDFIPKSF